MLGGPISLKFVEIICKNCGKQVKTKVGGELCSISCIREWREEEQYFLLYRGDSEKKAILEGFGQ